MGEYAKDTSVAAETSRAEIEKILRRYGADSFMYGWVPDQAVVQFKANSRFIRFVLPMPSREDRKFTHTPEKGLRRTPSQAEKEWEQATRQRWRALALVIKAKLEAVESGISEFEAEFLANIVLPGDQTVGDLIRPRIEEAYATGVMPSGMLALGAAT